MPNMLLQYNCKSCITFNAVSKLRSAFKNIRTETTKALTKMLQRCHFLFRFLIQVTSNLILNIFVAEREIFEEM